MLNKRAAAEQLRKYATVARFIREHREMQKRAGWFWPSKPKPQTVDNSRVSRPSPEDKYDMLEMLDNGNNTTARQRGELTDHQKKLRAWQQEGCNSTRWYQPGDQFRRLLGCHPRLIPLYNMAFPMPNDYKAPGQR